MAISDAVGKGVLAGLVAGIPQVLLTQAEARLVGVGRERADIGPRFIARAAQHEGRPLPPTVQWLLAGVFHFEYAALWGALYALALEPFGPQRVPPLLGGSLLGTAAAGDGRTPAFRVTLPSAGPVSLQLRLSSALVRAGKTYRISLRAASTAGAGSPLAIAFRLGSRK
jgi:hypothetical protein